MVIRENFSETEKQFIEKFDARGGDVFFANLRTIFQEHYDHSRHQEWQRTIFTTILGGLVAAIFSSFDKLPVDVVFRISVFSVGFAISSLGFLLMYMWNRAFIRHYTFTEMIVVNYWKLVWLGRFKQDRLDPSKVSLMEVLFEHTSGNVFYSFIASFAVMFAFLIGYTVEISQQIDKQIGFILAGIVLAIMVGIRVWVFGIWEMNAKREILKRHWDGTNPFSQNPSSTDDNGESC